MMFYITTAVIIYFPIGVVFLIATLFELIRGYEKEEDIQFDDKTKTILKVSFFLWVYALYIIIAQSVSNAVVNIIWKLSHRANRKRRMSHGNRIRTVPCMRKRNRY